MLGMIKGGAADRAGVRQGDEILRVNGQEIGPLSPFKVAGLMQGAESEASDDSDTFVDLEVTSCTSAVLCGVYCLVCAFNLRLRCWAHESKEVALSSVHCGRACAVVFQMRSYSGCEEPFMLPGEAALH